jgi:hypothetical protein
VNLEKIIEWVAIVLVVILGARWLGGLFGTGDPVQGGVQAYMPGYGGYYYGTGQPRFGPMVVYQGRNWSSIGQRGRRGR